ncbi:MAG: TonB-dependent receptor [Luminiphilus sp.]|nr:TonB-dependent receptor [Luminiphilus sp.]
MNKKITAAFATSHLVVLLAFAPLAKAEEVDEIIVSATGIPTPISQIGSSVDVITAKDLEQQQITYLQDALKGLKGVTFDQEGGTGGIGYLRMRGLDRQNVVVFVDGVNIADAADAQGGAEIGNFLLDDIERIEIMRGANSVLYGSNAVAGVIDIRTKSAGGTNAGKVSVRAGSNKLKQMTLGTSGEIMAGRLGYRLSLQSIDVSSPSEFDEEDSDFSEGEEYQNITASGAFALHLNDRMTARLSLRSIDSSADTDGYDPTTFAQVDGYFGNNTQQNLIRLSIEGEESEALTWTASHSFLGNYRDTFAEVGSSLWYDGERETTEIRASYRFSEDGYLNIGAEHKSEELFQNGLPRPETAETDAVFAVWHDQIGSFFTTLGVRQDDHSNFGSHESWRAGTFVQIDDLVGMRLNAGIGYRSPSLYELFGRDATCVDGLCGNQNLQPEETETAEIGFIFSRDPSIWDFDISYFSLNTENRIVYDNVGPPSYAGNYQNDVGESTSTGVEASIFAAISSNLTVQLNHSRLNPRKADGTIQNSQQRRLWSARADYNSPDGAHEFSLNARKVSDRYRSGERQEDYFTVGFSYGIRLYETLRLFVGGDNIFDEHYQTAPGKSTPRRTFNVGVSSSF